MNFPRRLTSLLTAALIVAVLCSASFAGITVEPEGLEFTVPHEVEGLATLRLTNTGGAVLQFGITSNVADGFKGSYYSNAAGASPAFGELVFQRQDALINFNWQAGGPGNGLANDNFGVKWEGIFVAPENGRYAFRTTTDEGVRLYIDGERRINDWVNHNVTSRDWAGNLSFGPHRIRMEYYEDRFNAEARLLWTPPGGQQVAMPGRSERGWIKMEPSHGNLAVGAPVDVEITILTANLVEGRAYTDSIIVSSNDQNNPTIIIPVSLQITPWQPGAMRPGALGVARVMQANAREQSQLVLHSVGRGNYEFEATIEGNDRAWLTVSPASGSIGPGLQLPLNLSFNSTARNAGVYNATLVLTGNDERNPVTRIPVTMAIGVPMGTIFGQVTALAGGDPVPGAVVGVVGMGFTAVSGDNGTFELAVPAGRQTLWVEHGDFLDFRSNEFDLANNGRTEVNPQLRFSTFDPSLETVQMFLAPDNEESFRLSVSNQGNGPVSWKGEIQFDDSHVHGQWAERMRFDVEIDGNERINGAEFVDGHFYVSGGVTEQDAVYGRIYVFDENGEYEREFPQFREGAQFGMRDLAWANGLLWGADGRTIYGFTTEGELQVEFQGPVGDCRALAFDPARGEMWASDTRGFMFTIDLEGNQIAQYPDPGGRKYGFAWYPNDPDGCPLYMFTNDNAQHVIALEKYSPEAGEKVFEADLAGIAADRAGGLGISGTWDPYSWTLIAQMNSSVDAVSLFHITSRTEWIGLPTTEGTIDAGDAGDVEISINSDGLVLDAQYLASVVFTHDGVGGETIVNVELNVGQEGGVAQRAISLSRGWNLVSTNVVPEGGDNFTNLMAPLVENGMLILAKDGRGNFFWPERDFDNIGSWNALEGYWLKVSGNGQLMLSGEIITMDTPIELNAGWNTVSYIPRVPANPMAVLSGLNENLVIARDGHGRFYLPAYGFSDIDLMQQGEGYQMRVVEAAQLIYSFNGAASRGEPRYSASDLKWIEASASTPSMHNILVQSSLSEGTRLKALTPSGIVAGRGVVGADGLAGLTVWGDDPMTEACDGFATGEQVAIRLAGNGAVVEYSVKEGVVEFTDGGMGVVTLEGTTMPTEFAIASAYPNPFNNTLQITYSLTANGVTSLKVFDLAGREAASLVTGNVEAGVHNAVWRAEGVPSGIYMLQLEAGSQKVSQKVLLLK